MQLIIFVFGIFFSVVTVMSIAGPSKAEYYQYRDKNGYTVFTDNLVGVPEDKWNEAEATAQKEISSVPSNARRHMADNVQQWPPAVEGEWERGIKKQAVELDAERIALEQRFDQLLAEQAAIGRSPGPGALSADKINYRNRINTLNRKIIAYERDREQFEKKVAELTAGLEFGR